MGDDAMNLTCIGCNKPFEVAAFRGYCDECIEAFNRKRDHIHASQHPAPNVFADGKFATESPKTAVDPVTGQQVCGLCGSDEVSMGYGLGSGFGMGSYTFCENCYAFLDFCEDAE